MNTAISPRPPHVPQDRVFEFDIYDFDVEGAEYQSGMRRLQQPDVPEVFWTAHNGGHWVVTRSREISRVLSEYTSFSSRQIVIPAPPPEVKVPPLMPLQIDPPNHLKYRKLLMAALAPKAVQGLGEKARALAIELIDGFKTRGHCEFIGEFASHLPIAIFMQIVDLPESDRIYLSELAHTTMRGETAEARDAARQEIAMYGMQKVKERRENPGPDLISTLCTTEVDGALLDDFTLTGMITLLFLAGLDTVASMLGFFARFLALNPEHRRQLIAEPSLIPNAVEELLRRYPVAVLAREVVAEVELCGAALRPGDMVLVPTALDGMDERAFPDPLTVDFNRHKPMHATFGGGAHRCMGSMLARTELRVFLEEWLRRIPDFDIAPGADIKVGARTVATLTTLPLVWDPASVL
jgi:cytochrome P450